MRKKIILLALFTTILFYFISSTQSDDTASVKSDISFENNQVQVEDKNSNQDFPKKTALEHKKRKANY